MMVTWLSPLDLEAPAGAGVQVGKEEAKQLADAGRFGEIQKDLERFREIQRDLGDLERFRAVQSD